MGENDNKNTNGGSILWEGQCFALEDGDTKRLAVPVGDEDGADHYEALTPQPCGTIRRERVSLVPYFGLEDSEEYGAARAIPRGRGMVEAARMIAEAAHEGQVDMAGAPYIEHPAFVAARVRDLGGDTTAIAAAWLHDVVEDTPFTLDALSAVLPDDVVRTVDALTRRSGESYLDYVSRAGANDRARLVKVCDLAHNMDASRLGPMASSAETASRMERYREAMRILGAAPGPYHGHS
jgi:hypothetical protein